MGAYCIPTTGPVRPVRPTTRRLGAMQNKPEKGPKSGSELTHRNKPPNSRTNPKKGREPAPKDEQMRSLTLGQGQLPEASTPGKARDVVPIHEKPPADNCEVIDSDESESSTEGVDGPEHAQRATTAPAKNPSPSPPAPATSTAEDAMPTDQYSANKPDFKPKDSGTQAQSHMPWTHDDERTPRPAEPARDNYPPTSTFTSGQDEQVARPASSIDLTDLDEPNSDTVLAQQHSGPHMFTHARAKIFGGKFVNIYEFDSPALGSGPAFPIAVLGLQTVSFATRSHYTHCNYPLEPAPVVSSPSTIYVTLRFPSLDREMRIAMAPLTLWFLMKLWIQRRANQNH